MASSSAFIDINEVLRFLNPVFPSPDELIGFISG